ncbi:hypothetical protein [Methylobacterium planeticum]|uniref:Uncharacterized protein n=1 Tax=Methylobacterium planeticum TaxID=2615211 RepID=A0A6N6MMQ0_9HYPH|nr:hypothetical protein [Methylobacterium planeticum]KAB1072640.1 hypothetical protein F6X51_15255 [Methylobacterium planeticum]
MRGGAGGCVLGRRMPRLGMDMTYSGTDDTRDSADHHGDVGGGEPPSDRQRAETRQTLDQIADALGVASALLSTDAPADLHAAGDTVTLQEASALLQAYFRIPDREARQRCLDCVRAAAR